MATYQLREMTPVQTGWYWVTEGADAVIVHLVRLPSNRLGVARVGEPDVVELAAFCVSRPAALWCGPLWAPPRENPAGP